MKKVFLFICLIAQISLLKAQNSNDAVRYSLDNLEGTARYMSMSGAFGALGGDLSALKVNPAGSAVFLTNQAAISLDISAYKNETDYTNGHNVYNNNNVNLNQAGIVFVFNNTNKEATVSRLSLGVAYDRTNSYDNRYTAAGLSHESISDRFLNFAQGVPLDLFTRRSGETLADLYSYLGTANVGFNNNRLQSAYLGYETFIFNAANPNDPDNTTYTSNVSGNNFEHIYHNYSNGSQSKLTFNGGLALNNRIYLGVNLNSYNIDFQRTIIFNEYIAQPSNINEINFVNTLDTKGTGFSFQIGGIARLGNIWRVGVSYESPTWYKINDETTQFLRTYSQQFGEAVANPGIINVFPDYKLRTPGKITGSIAAVFGKSGLISFDYSYQDFSNIKYTSPGFDSVNENINTNLQAVSTYSLGGEYRLKALSLRAGLRYQNSPYTDGTIGDLQSYSLGLGYNFGGLRIDLAYNLAKREYNRHLLHTGFSEQASIDNTLSQYVVTLAFAL